MISIGFYHRQFFFFLGLFGILFGVGWTIHQQTSQASSTRPITILENTNRPATVQLIIADRGRGFVQDTAIGQLIEFGQDSDELRYLFVDQPSATIDKLTVEITFPRPIDERATHATALVIHDPITTWSARWQSPTVLSYQFQDVGPGATITLVTQLPKGAIEPSLTQRIFGSIQSLPKIIWLSLGLFLPFVAFALLLFVFRAHLKDRWSDRVSTSRQTPPTELTPAMVAALVDGRVSARAIAATLLDLARRQFLEISSHDGTYTFTKRRRLLSGTDRAELLPFEEALLAKIFAPAAPQSTAAEMQVRIGTTLFSQKVAEVYMGIYDEVTDEGYFLRNPSTIHGTYRFLGLILFFLGLVGFGFGVVFFADPPTPLLFWIGMILAALVVIMLAPHLPNHTSRGLVERQQWLAFRRYLTSNQPLTYDAQMHQQFFTYLPYAVALGVEVEWAGRFLNTPLQLPDWYSSAGTMARLEDFVNDLFPMVGFLAQDLALVREPTLS